MCELCELCEHDSSLSLHIKDFGTYMLDINTHDQIPNVDHIPTIYMYIIIYIYMCVFHRAISTHDSIADYAWEVILGFEAPLIVLHTHAIYHETKNYGS